MSDKDERIFNKLDMIDGRLNEMSGTLIKQEANLSTHIKRTDMLEKRVEQVQEHFDERIDGEVERINSMENVVVSAKGFISISIKILLVTSTIVGILLGLIKLLS